MIYYLLNLFLTIVWVLINGSYTALDFLIGFLVGFISLWITQPFSLKTSYFKRFTALIALLGYFIYEMLISVLRVTWDVLTPTHLSDPDIIYIPLDAKTDLEITLLSNIVSLTPGTLSLDVTENRKFLIIHAMFAPDHESVIHSVKHGIEKRLLEVTRG